MAQSIWVTVLGAMPYAWDGGMALFTADPHDRNFGKGDVGWVKSRDMSLEVS